MASWIAQTFWKAFVLWHARQERRLPYRPLERLRALQDRRLRRIVAHAHRHVPFYREALDARGLTPRDIRTTEDLARLPIVTSADLAADPDRFRSRALSGAPLLEIPTTGTTGLHRDIRHDRRAVFLALAAGWRRRVVLGRFLGRTRGYRHLSLRPVGGTTERVERFHREHLGRPRLVDPRRQAVSSREPFSTIAERIDAIRPEVLSGFGAVLGAVFQRARKEGRPLHLPRVVRYGGDHLPPSDRRLLEDDLGIPVLSSYQACEALRIGFQCERRAGFHVDMDQVAVRIVGDDGKDVGRGVPGRVVLSNLINRATVLLNVDLSDVATWATAPCPCGRTLPVLELLHGRADDLVVRPDGETLHVSVLLPPLYDVPGVVRVQVVQEEADAIRLLVETESGDGDGTRDVLASVLRDRIGGPEPVRVEVETVAAIPAGPGGKLRSVVSRLARASLPTDG